MDRKKRVMRQAIKKVIGLIDAKEVKEIEHG